MSPALLARLDDPAPHGRLLSNGRYTVLVTGAGTGFSRCAGYALTPWSGDRTEDGDGFFVYLRDLERHHVWSAGYQPVGRAGDFYCVEAEPGCVRFRRRDDGIETRLAVCVAPDDDVEVRSLELRNLSDEPRRLEVTSYVEVVLLDPMAHAAHPAFSKLFVETEYAPHEKALLAHRRSRGGGERHPWLVHALAGARQLEYETDRARFAGRGRTLAAPHALLSTRPLSGTAGNVLDPVLSLRCVVCLEPGERAALAHVLGTAPTRAAALGLARGYAAVVDGHADAQPPGAIAAVFAAAAEHERACLSRLGLSEADGARLHELACAMLYGHPALRAPAEVLARAHGSLGTLAAYGVSGTGLLVTVDVDGPGESGRAAEALAAQEFWRAHGLDAAVLFLHGEPFSLGDELRRLVATRGATADGAGPAMVLRRADLPAEHLDLIRAGAHLVATRGLRAAAALLDVGDPAPMGSAETPPSSGGTRHYTCAATAGGDRPSDTAPGPPDVRDTLLAANGYGGFSPDGSEYVVRLGAAGGTEARRPPMPWINVVASEAFGFLVSESGAGCTWSRNSRERRLTPWYNDPVRDPHGEAVYVRDEETGVFWSPTGGPAPLAGPVEVRHGFGYTSWRHTSQGLDQELCAFVPQRPADPVKITRLRITNAGDRPRRLSLVGYHRLVLGGLPSESARFVVTEINAVSGALLARNRVGAEFADGVVFAAAVAPAATGPVGYTADRTAFIGRNGDPAAPAALRRGGALDGATGAGLDPCAAVQVSVEVAPRATVECAFLLGEATDAAAVHAILKRYRSPAAIGRALTEARAAWAELLSAVRVDTPLPAVDLMLNGWLAYQATSCRLWGRSALYQSSGAFGFRDQLQDAMALVYARPTLTRAQILHHAAQQFVEGDVLHWWHPPSGRGTRTRFSDDLLWLPYVTAFYVNTTGDWGVLDATAPFVTARALAPGEDEAMVEPTAAGEMGDVYTHCCRALDRSLTRGAHGLPLMGTGDWNDGMNRVGREGRGESVWLAFFLHYVLDGFTPICERRGDRRHVERYRAYQRELRVALEASGWDGGWYRRAYYDDGTPLGSAANDECQIDAIAQAWAVISGAAERERAALAMDAVERLLVSRVDGVIRLLAPPFDRDPHDPGYIKGYVPGIRENGGQYTHAALWVVQALAQLRRRDRAAALLAMLSPVSHTATPEQVSVYQVEPYVVAADVYGVAPHVGRGGWTWYTGSAAWMYRIALESVLGVRIVNGDTLCLSPCVPDDWPRFQVRLRLPGGGTFYEIEVRNPDACSARVTAVAVDEERGVVDEDGVARVRLVDDGARHRVEVTLGAAVVQAG